MRRKGVDRQLTGGAVGRRCGIPTGSDPACVMIGIRSFGSHAPYQVQPTTVAVARNEGSTCAALLREYWEGMRAQHAERRTEAELVENAIMRVHRGFFGLAPGSQDGPDQSTGPFRKWASDRWAEVLLRQVDAKTYRLAQPFRYDDGTNKFKVPEDIVTDLASVPRFFTWLVPRYGRHTLAALLHDHLVDDTSFPRERADVLFRDSMRETGVPLSRRWLMWAAVALTTQWKLGGLRQARVVLWIALFGLAALVLWPTVVYVLATSFGWPAVGLGVLAVAAAMIVPLALSWPWGRHWKVGALGGIALMFFSVQVVLVLFALGLYLGVEKLIEWLFVKPANRNPVLARNL